MPRFIALADANPSDEAAFQCCQWVFDRSGNVGTDDREIFAADKRAWQIIGAHHAAGDKIPKLCLQAVQYYTPAREQFLRDLLKREKLPKEHVGFATLALAELLAGKCECIEAQVDRPSKNEFANFAKSRRDPEWSKDLTPANLARFKNESANLFRTVIDQYADVPITESLPHFRDVPTLGTKAEKSLLALVHLSLGAEAPDIAGLDLNGKPLKLHDFRGRVVLLSFWFTGCGPCMAMIPKERKLVEAFKDRPFTLLGISNDGTAEQSLKTAKEENISWSCWSDGWNGPIARNYNVLSWPTFFLLDKDGRIVAKDLDRDDIEAEIAKLLDKNK